MCSVVSKYWIKFHYNRVVVNYSIMMLVKFLTSANQKHRIWSCDESELCNPRPRLRGDEVVVAPVFCSGKWIHEMSLEIYCRTKLTKINCKEKWYSVAKMTFLIKLVFFIRNTWIYECMELEFYLKNSTGKSYSNIRVKQRPFVNEDLNVANKWWTVLTYN